MKQATDYVAESAVGSLAVRIREADTEERDWTIRAKTRYNKRTEIHKLLGGWARFYVYGWKKTAVTLGEYILIDLDTVRASELLEDWEGRFLWDNYDGTKFVVYTVQELRNVDALVEEGLNTIESRIRMFARNPGLNSLSDEDTRERAEKFLQAFLRNPEYPDKWRIFEDGDAGAIRTLRSLSIAAQIPVALHRVNLTNNTDAVEFIP